MPKFDIILTVWNRIGYTKRTIASLIDSDAVAQCERFIIVDNRSTEEGMSEFLETLYKDMPDVSHKVFILRRAKNDGWGMAVNDALGLSRSEYLLLCNNDVEFVPNFMEKAFKIYAELGKGAYVSAQENLKYGLGLLGLWRHTAHGDTKGGIKTDYFVETDNAPAVAWLLWKPAMMKVGLMPEHGPCLTKGGNGEDTGYYMKIREAGYLTGCAVPDLATHIDGY